MSVRQFRFGVLTCSLLFIIFHAASGQPNAQQASPPVSPTASPAPAPTPTPETGLIVSPTSLNFEAITNDTTTTQTVLLVNKSTTPLSVTYSVSPADFKADTACKDLIVNSSCSISITFTPTQSGKILGTLTVNASPAENAKTPKTVCLNGTGLPHCKRIGSPFSLGTLLLFILVGFYLLAVVLVRWHMLAKPDRVDVIAKINSVRSWLATEAAVAQPPNPEQAVRVAQINHLLDLAARSVGDPPALPPATRFFNAIFWTRGVELAAWKVVHAAEQQMIELLPEARVRASMATALAELKQLKGERADALAKRLEQTLAPAANVPLPDLRALFAEALGLIAADRDGGYDTLFTWHNKIAWLIGCSLLFILAIGITFDNAVLMLVGAVGGLLSRLMQNLKAAESSDDFGATWGALFLSPLTGALAAWGGILLMILAAKLQILGAILKFDWCNPYEPMTLAVALLLGFTERLFDDLTTKVIPKVLPNTPGAGTPGAGGAPGAPVPPAPAPPAPAPPGAVGGQGVGGQGV